MDGSPVTACSLRRIAGEQGGGQVLATVDSGNGIGVFEQSMVLRDEAGWRTQWIVRGLTASTNYTAFVVQEGTKVSGPIYFATKSGASVLSVGLTDSYAPNSDLLVSTRPQPHFLPLHCLCRSPSPPPIHGHVHDGQLSTVRVRPAHPVHTEFYDVIGHVSMWPGYVQSCCGLRRLRKAVPGLGMQRDGAEVWRGDAERDCEPGNGDSNSDELEWKPEHGDD